MHKLLYTISKQIEIGGKYPIITKSLKLEKNNYYAFGSNEKGSFLVIISSELLIVCMKLILNTKVPVCS